MGDLISFLRDNLEQFDATAALDVFLIWLLLFWVLVLLKNTTAMAVIRGATILLIGAFILGRVFDLRVLNFILRNSFIGLLIALPVIFREEIRRALERVGHTTSRAFGGALDYETTIDALSAAVAGMSKKRVGALIVLERESGLQEYTEKGHLDRRGPFV